MSVDSNPPHPIPPERPHPAHPDDRSASKPTIEPGAPRSQQQPPITATHQPFEPYSLNRRPSFRPNSSKRPSTTADTFPPPELTSGPLYSRPPPPGVRLVIFPPTGGGGGGLPGPSSAGPSSSHPNHPYTGALQSAHPYHGPRSGGNTNRQSNRPPPRQQNKNRRWSSNQTQQRRPPQQQQQPSFKNRGQTFHRRHDEFSQVYGRPKNKRLPRNRNNSHHTNTNKRKKGDYYRPPPVIVNLFRPDDVAVASSTEKSILPTQSEKPGLDASTPCTLTDVEIDLLLDDAFADLGLEIGGGEGETTDAERDADADEEEDDDEGEGCTTPPFAEWEYPDEIYVADRVKFREMGGTSLDRSFIGCMPPKGVLEGLDELP
ncbi:uncharacterized protein EV422DRAFT_567280 [Fimicolochytrium jonesii]|uniref:uncharacterized protein n=1 Tax=Fimicolochytrium jonesii TaxID=1396493 RepID=UPI0022FED7AE|nr:uncharacterized protein EV422DRAFT_567280 [Fimicolochytrium jonesii]KAI8820954.1 hypothetical protein EV422DRAFT_567280 [Fimicolochytrium jonesii]